MTFESFRYYLIFQLLVLFSPSLPYLLPKNPTFDQAETRETSTYQYTGTWNDTSSTSPDPRIDQPSTDDPLSAKHRDSKLPSCPSYTDLENFYYRYYVRNITDEIYIDLKRFGKMISETPILDDEGVEYIQIFLYLEISIMMATGNHFIIPPNEDKKIEKRLQKNVRALGAIFLDLRYDGVSMKILGDTIYGLSTHYRYNQSHQMEFPRSRVTVKKMQEYLLNVVNEIFNEIDDRDDSFANEFFKHRKSFANKEPITYISFDNMTLGIIEKRSIVEFSQNNLDFKKFFMHSEFVNSLAWSPTCCLFNTMAQESKLTINLNEIYMNILDKVTKLYIVDKTSKGEILRNFINEIITAIKTHEPLRKAYEDANIDYEKEIQLFKIWYV